MPIRPENRDRYPAEWKEISDRVREEAGQRCEWCAAENGALIARGKGADTGTYMMHDGRTFSTETGDFLGLSWLLEYDVDRFTKIVLTVAHLDHQPENCTRDNLVALCQRCHNRYDAPMRRRGIAERQRAEMADGDLFSSIPSDTEGET